MTRLSETQAIILSAAAQRSDRNVLPLPGSLRGGAAGKVVTALLTRGLICEVPIDSGARADTALNTIWRNDEDGRAILLRITEAGLEAIGFEPAQAIQRSAIAAEAKAGGAAAAAQLEAAQAEAPQRPGAGRIDPRASTESTTPAGAGGASASHTAPLRGKVREGTKQAKLIAMLRLPEGATITQAVEATGWQPHTVRGALAGALKKRLGLAITSEKVDGERVYRLPPA